MNFSPEQQEYLKGFVAGVEARRAKPASEGSAPPDAQRAAQDATLARNLAATCANCHGTNGQARGEMVSLAGRPADQLLTILAGYRSGAIPATIMHQIVKGYTEPQLQLIAGHFAAQKPVR